MAAACSRWLGAGIAVVVACGSSTRGLSRHALVLAAAEPLKIKVRQERRIIQVNRSIGPRKEHTATLCGERLQRLSNQIKRKTESLELVVSARGPLGHEWLNHDRAAAVSGQVTVARHRRRNPIRAIARNRLPFGSMQSKVVSAIHLFIVRIWAPNDAAAQRPPRWNLAARLEPNGSMQ
jgi:hypothetical protein